MRNPFNQSNPFKNEPIFKKRLSEKHDRSKPSYKGISRIDSDYNHTHGWYVRIRKNGKVKSRFFSDRKYGSIVKALMKARRHYRKQMLEIFTETHGPAFVKIPDRVIVTKNKNNNTGIIGVQRIDRKNPGGSIYRAYRVCWTERSGQAKTKFFSVAKYGEENAFSMARKFRKEMLLSS